MAAKEFRSVAAMFLHRITETPDKDAYQYPVGDSWKRITWREAGERVKAISSGLLSLGLELEERGAILSSTRVEWILADLGVLCAGGATTTIYPSNTADECAFIIEDSGTKFVFAEDDGQVEKLVRVRDQLPGLQKVITFEGKAGHDGWVMTLAELEEAGRAYAAEHKGELEEIIGSIGPQHLATLIYTSGTTGRPKGVELVHDCWVYEGWAIDEMGILNGDDHQYLWLPLSHSFGKVLEAAQLQCGFLTTVDGRIPKLVENLGVVKPTFMAAAPRIFEKVYNKVVTGMQQAGGIKLKIFEFAVKNGMEVSRIIQEGGKPGGWLGFKYAIADKLVFSRLRARFGGRLRFFVSGSAPLSLDMAEFFHSAGILILEGYGLTETSAATFVNRPESYTFGTVGPPLPGTEVRIAEEDGEILLKGRGNMRGYHNLPDVTAETIDEDGWLRTGDIGMVTDEGFLKITDRKKDLIKTSGGKYVAPQKLEARLKAVCPYLSQVLVHGNNRNFCVALVTLDEEGIPAWAKENGLEGKPIAELAKAPQVVDMVQKAVDKMNADLARYETIKKFAILPADLTIEGGELTASMKVKRKAVETKYAAILNGFFEGAVK